MTDKELAEDYTKRLHDLISEIKEREEHKKIKVVVTVRLSDEKEKDEEAKEKEKEYDFVEEYLNGTTNPLLRWYRDYRKREK